MYNFKKFENAHQRLENRITVTKSAAVGFPTKFYTDNHIGEYKFVVLYYDEVQKALGVHFTNDENEKNKFKIIHSKLGYGGNIIARSLFKSLDIDPKLYYGRYEWEKYPLEGVGEVFAIKLTERQIEQPKQTAPSEQGVPL